MQKYIYADKFYYLGLTRYNGYLEIKDGKFGSFYETRPLNGEIVDLRGFSIAPGLVDTHIHGRLGYDVMDDDANSLHIISKSLLSCGVTSFLPTTLTASKEKTDNAVTLIAREIGKEKGARIKGIFLEGPFFTETHKGAQNPKYFAAPSIGVLKEWQQLSGGLIKKIALAAEISTACEFIKEASAMGVVCALGHTDASYDETKAAVEAGASVFVHTYNGMRGMTHHDPGVVGAAMTLNDVFAELICDGHHVHPVAAKILMDMRGRNQVALITDCMRAGGMPDGDYKLGEFDVKVIAGMARMNNGSLAGSVLNLNEAVKNVYDWGIASDEEAILMATYVPALSAKIDDSCGQIKKGRDADFIVLDKEMNLIATYLNGEEKYKM